MKKIVSQKQITYLRVSITDRCNLRCRYCMDEEGIEKFSHDDILRFEEIERLLEIFKKLGIKKIRFTGGEPFLRRGVLDFFEKIKDGFYVTTNLSIPSLNVERINNLPISGINISCDSLDPQKYRYITRVGDFGIFMQNFKRLKIKNRKINVVLIKNFNDDEILKFIDFALRENVVLRFIEKMDFVKNSLKFLSLLPVREFLIKKGILEKEFFTEGNSVAEYHFIKGTDLKIGFITPVSKPFCFRCDKLRLKANGELLSCLYSKESLNLKKLIRSGFSDREIIRFVVAFVKKADFPWSHKSPSAMVQIGG
ncbi:MAG: GTP 3',8-cyclase MoaA [Candidatus Heimdallarchaeaceae archaeon]